MQVHLFALLVVLAPGYSIGPAVLLPTSPLPHSSTASQRPRPLPVTNRLYASRSGAATAGAGHPGLMPSVPRMHRVVALHDGQHGGIQVAFPPRVPALATRGAGTGAESRSGGRRSALSRRRPTRPGAAAAAHSGAGAGWAEAPAGDVQRPLGLPGRRPRRWRRGRREVGGRGGGLGGPRGRPRAGLPQAPAGHIERPVGLRGLPSAVARRANGGALRFPCLRRRHEWRRRLAARRTASTRRAWPRRRRRSASASQQRRQAPAPRRPLARKSRKLAELWPAAVRGGQRGQHDAAAAALRRLR